MICLFELLDTASENNSSIPNFFIRCVLIDILTILSSSMNNLNVNQFYQYVMKGALLIAAMVVYSISDRLEVRRRAS